MNPDFFNFTGHREHTERKEKSFIQVCILKKYHLEEHVPVLNLTYKLNNRRKTVIKKKPKTIQMITQQHNMRKLTLSTNPLGYVEKSSNI